MKLPRPLRRLLGMHSWTDDWITAQRPIDQAWWSGYRHGIAIAYAVEQARLDQERGLECPANP